MNSNELVKMIDDVIVGINITPPERSAIDYEVADRLIQIYGDVVRDYAIDYIKDVLTDKTTKKIAHKRCSINDLYLTTIRNWIKDKHPIESKQNNGSGYTNNKATNNKYVQMAQKILGEIQMPTNDIEFQKWYKAKCKVTIGYAPPCYSKPFENTSLDGKRALQDKYQKAFTYAIMDASEAHMIKIKNDPNMQNLAIRAFDEDDYILMAI